MTWFIPVKVLAGSQDNEKVRTTTARAQQPGFVLPTDKKKLEFDFWDIKATVDEDGNASVEGPIKHIGLLCGTYAIGLQLGQGEYACTNVKWLTDPVYITSHRHCNNATLIHKGGMNVEQFKSFFSKVTCAKRLIRCTGVCK